MVFRCEAVDRGTRLRRSFDQRRVGFATSCREAHAHKNITVEEKGAQEGQGKEGEGNKRSSTESCLFLLYGGRNDEKTRWGKTKKKM